MNRQFMRQAQELQARLAKIQEELAKAEVEGTSGGGAVKITVNGQHKIISVKISPDVVKAEEVEMLEDLIVSAFNDATTKAEQLAQKSLGVVTGGLKIPGMM